MTIDQPAELPHRKGLQLLVHCAFVALPVLSLGLMAIAWLKHGIDLPYRDDWREYLTGKIGSLDLAHVFRSDNDTLSITTRIFDALAQRLLDGNSIAYQFLTMVAVLGSLLWLQWRLLIRATGHRLIAASAFSATLFMLQPDSYWGWQNLAYIQAVPLVAILAAVYVALYARCAEILRATLVLALVLFAGTTYISGAVASFAAGLVLVAVFSIKRRDATTRWPAIAFMLGSFISLCLQLWVILGVQGGKTHRADAAWALPGDLDFWMYLLGKVGRGLMLPAQHPTVALAIAVVACIAMAALATLCLRAAFMTVDPEGDERARSFVILPTLCAAVAAYLLIVAAGRTNLRPEHVQEPLAVFQHGYLRFHYFWITILIPWALAGITMLRPTLTFAGSKALPITAAIGAAFVLASGGLRHDAYFSAVSNQRQADIDCLREGLMHRNAIRCPFAPYGDLTNAYRYALRTDASFIRYFPPSMLAGNREKGPSAEILSGQDGSISVRHAPVLEYRNGTLELGAGTDAQIHFQIPSRQMLTNCVLLRISASISPKIADTAQLFYQPTGTTGYREEHSTKAVLNGAQDNSVDFLLESPEGFRNAFRFDPTAKSQGVLIKDVRATCLL